MFSSVTLRAAAVLVLGALGACGSGGREAALQGFGGGSLEFDANANTSAHVGSSSVFEITGAITLEAWIRAEPGQKNPFPRIIDKFNFFDQQGYNLILNDGRLYFEVFLPDGSSRSIFGSTELDDGDWHHVAATYDGSQFFFVYVDGLPDGKEDVGPITIAVSSNPLVIGGGNDGGGDLPFEGHIDEPRVWNVARTSPEIADGRFACFTGFETGLVGHWRFDEGSGSVARDETPFGNHASLVNGPAWSAETMVLCGGPRGDVDHGGR
jgi:hypothetical protein